MELLGSEYTFGLLVAMTILMGVVYWFFMSLGRRLQESGYLGPLASDAIANAEIARQEKRLQEDLARGDIAPTLDPTSDEFKRLYDIPSGALAPELPRGIVPDEYIRSAVSFDGWGTRLPGLPSSATGGLGGSGINPFGGRHQAYSRDQFAGWNATQLEAERMRVEAERDKSRHALEQILREGKNKSADAQKEDARKEFELLDEFEDTLRSLKDEINRRFTLGHRKELMSAFQKKRKEIMVAEAKNVKRILPLLDTSTFSGSWIFLLEFTTIVFIVYAVLSLGVLGVLDSQPIATILAAVAGYVLGKSTTLRGGTGEEIRRGAEEPKAVLDLLAKQEEARSSRDAEKTKLQQQVEDLQQKLSQTKVAVPDLANLSSAEAEDAIRNKDLIFQKTEVENSKNPGKVFLQDPRAGAEVPKNSTIHVFIAKAPTQSKAA